MLGQKVSVPMTRQVLQKISCHWRVIQNNVFPPVRIAGTFTQCGNKVLLFGGFGKCPLNDLYQLDLKSAKWELVSLRKPKRPCERYGHTAVNYQGMLIIFGGEQKYNPEIKMRETLCDLWMYSTTYNEFKMLSMGNKILCEPRKDHVMAIVGSHIFVQGGIDSKGHLIDSPIYYDLCNSRLIFIYVIVRNQWS